MIRFARVMMIGLAAAVVAGGMATPAAAQPDESDVSPGTSRPILRQRCEGVPPGRADGPDVARDL